MRAVQRFFSFVIVVILPLAAFAQSSQRMRDRDPDLEASKKLAAELQQANFHYGPFYLLSRIRVSDAGFTEGSSSLPTGDQQGVLSISVEAPQRLYFVPNKKSVYTVEVTPGYSFFRTDTEERDGQFNYIARADAHYLFNHLYLDVYGMREDVIRAFVADINRLATVRSDELGVAGEVKYSSKTSALFNVRLRDSDFPGARYQPTDFDVTKLNRKEKNGRLSLMHKTFPLTSLFVAGERSDYEFETDLSRDSTRTAFTGGALYNSGRTTLRVEAGPVRLDFENPLQKDYSGLTAALAATHNSGRRTYAVSAERDLGFSIFGDDRFFVSTILRAGINQATTRKLTLRANTTFERDEFDALVNGVEREDTISFTSVGFAYTFRRLSAGADIGWYERTSTIGFGEDSGIRTVIHLSFTP